MAKDLHTGLMSMTGFASKSGVLKDWTWMIEVRSVNGRGLDLRFRMPDWIEGLEAETRKMFQSKLARGNITVNVKVQRGAESGGLAINDQVLQATLATMSKIEAAAKAAGVNLAPVTASDIASMRGVIDVSDANSTEDIPPLRAAVLDTLSDALEAFEIDRAREGADLGRVLSEQIERVEEFSIAAAKVVGDREAAARAGLERALARVMDVTEVQDEARLVQELALIAVKNDVTEELDRLSAHISAARALMSETGAVGRKFDFLMQEFNREANTLCSKSQSTELTAIGLDLKAVIDQMREQVQNIE